MGIQRRPDHPATSRDELLGGAPRAPLPHLPVRNADELCRNTLLVGYNTREFQSVSGSYTFGRNFDSDFRLLGAAVRRQITEGFNVEYELSRLWLDPDPENASTYIHVFRAVQNFTPDLFIKVFFQTNSAISRENVQAVFVWRYKPPFGTIQFAFERGTAAFGERSEQANTFFVKFSYVI